MKEPTAAGRELERPASALGSAHMRIAVLDTDSGFLQVLGKRLERLGWEHRVLASPVPTDTVVAMRLNAIVIDLAVLGPQAWDYLEKLCAALPGLGVVVCTAQSTVAQRVRGLRLGRRRLADEAVPSRGAARPRRGGRAPPPPRRGARGALADPCRRGRDPRGSLPGLRRRPSVDLTRREFELIELLAGAEGRVLEREEIYQRVWGYAMARGDRSVDVFVRKLRQKLEKASPDWRYIHTHFGVGYRFSPEPVEGTAAAAAVAAPGGWRRVCGGGFRAGSGGRRAGPGSGGGRRAQRRSGRRRPGGRQCARRPRAVGHLVAATGAFPAWRRGTPPPGRVPCGACRRPCCATSRSSSPSRRRVAFIPGGGDAASLIGALFSTAILAAFVMLAVRFYRENRMDILGLPDRWRAIFYGALGVIVLAMAARPRLIETGGGLLVWLAAVAGSAYALYRVWRQYREYA